MTTTDRTPQHRDASFSLLEVDSVSKHFGGRGLGTFVAVDGVSLTFDSTKMIGIVGESGSGKSTLARMMVGLERPSSGSVTLNGRELVSQLAMRADRVYARRTLQFVGQDTTSSFDPRRTLRDAVRRPAILLNGSGKDAADAQVDSILERLGLSPAQADRYPFEVSGGQRQRFALARALVVSPRLLVCDEVVSALDVSVQGSILNMLKKYCAEQRAGLTFVSHGLPATAFIADELVVMLNGRIVERGPTQRVIDAPEHPHTIRLLEAYRGRTTPRTQVYSPEVADWSGAANREPSRFHVPPDGAEVTTPEAATAEVTKAEVTKAVPPRVTSAG